MNKPNPCAKAIDTFYIVNRNRTRRCREKWQSEGDFDDPLVTSPEPSLVTIPLNSVSKSKPYDQHQLERTLHHIFHRIGLVGPPHGHTDLVF